MSQVSKRVLSKNIQDQLLENLWHAFADIKNAAEAEILLADFLSPTEKVMFAKRIAIAILLKKNYDFRSISKLLRVSTTTINNIYKMMGLNSKSYNFLIDKYNRRQTTKELFRHLERDFFRLRRGKLFWQEDVIKARLGHKKSMF